MTEPNARNWCAGAYPDWLEVHLTSKCNGKCAWCVEKNGWAPGNTATWEAMVAAALKTGRKNIMLLGGEPTLHPDLGSITEALYSAGKSVYITTNGSRLSWWSVERALIFCAGVNISIHHHDLDRNEDITGVRLDDSTLRGAVEFIQITDVPVRLNCNIISGQIDNRLALLDYIAWAKEMGASAVRFAELKGDDEHFVSLAQIAPQGASGLTEDPFVHGCSTDWEYLGIPVSFRQMCGLHTKHRPQHETTSQLVKQVLYEDGILYDGWQTKDEESGMDQEDVLLQILDEAQTPNVEKLIQLAVDGKLTAAEAAQLVRQCPAPFENHVAPIRDLHVAPGRRPKSTSSGNCQY